MEWRVPGVTQATQTGWYGLPDRGADTPSSSSHTSGMTKVGAGTSQRGAKIGISLPQSTLEIIEAACRERNQSRSEFFRQAAEALLRREREREAVQSYLRGYREHPESEEEVGTAHEAASAALAHEPWE